MAHTRNPLPNASDVARATEELERLRSTIAGDKVGADHQVLLASRVPMKAWLKSSAYSQPPLRDHCSAELWCNTNRRRDDCRFVRDRNQTSST